MQTSNHSQVQRYLITQLKKLHFNPYYNNHLITSQAYFPKQEPQKSLEATKVSVKTPRTFAISHVPQSKKQMLMIEYPTA
ncbi:hypothetical protein HDU91_004447, partial [Kappamyces sp. JEL0680]